MSHSNIVFAGRLDRAWLRLLTLGRSASGHYARRSGFAKTLMAGVVERLAAPFKNTLSIYSRLGFELLLDRNSAVDAAMIRNGEWEPAQVAFLQQLTEVYRGGGESIFLDIGAYWGLYALTARQTQIFNQILAFESDGHNFAQLQSNLFLNRAAKEIRAFNNAVSDRNDVMHVMDSLGHPTGNRGGVGKGDKDCHLPTSQVVSVTIDSLLSCSDRNLAIKIDVEGHEQFVLAGMKRTVENNRIIMQVEIFEAQQAAVLPQLEALGLRHIHTIEHDFYYTNIDRDKLGF